MRTILVILLTLFSYTVTAQTDTTCFSNEQVLRISNKIKDLEQKDSINVLLIQELKSEIGNYKTLHAQDSVMMTYKNMEIDLHIKQTENYKELAKLNKPKWWEHRYIWFVLGASSIIASSHVVANTAP